MAGAPIGGNAFTQASQGLTGSMLGTAGEMAYQPQQVQATGYAPAQVQSTGYNPAFAQSTGYNAAQMQAGQLANTDLSPYMNPYEQSVIGGMQNDAFNQYQRMNNQLGAEASAANAFGGSRHGVAQGTMATGVQDALNKQVAQLRLGGFQNAQQMAMGDIANQMGASQANMNALNQARAFGAGAFNQMALANQGAANQAGQFGATAANTAALQNQAALNQAGQFTANNLMQAQLANQGAGLNASQQRLAASGQLGNLANTSFGMGTTMNNQMMQQGALQQALQQMVMDKASGQYAGYQNSPYQALQAMTSAVGASPAPTTTTTTGSTGQNRGLFDYLGMGLYGAGVLAPAGGYSLFA